MKRLNKRRLLLAAVFLIAFSLFNYIDRRSYRCQTCFSQRHDYQWRIGDWGPVSLPLTFPFHRVQASKFQTELFPQNHEHDWQFAQGSPYYCYGLSWGGCALGRGRHTSQIFSFYERDPEFRRFVRKEIDSHRISESKFVQLVAAHGQDSPLTKEADDFLDSFFESK